MATSTKKKKPAAKRKAAVSHKKKPNKKKTAAKPSVNRKGVLLAVVAVLAVLGIAALVLLLNGKGANGKKTAVPLPDKSVAWGIDVSSHNGEIDWKGVAKEADFAFVRVGFRGYTEGEINEDPNYKDNLKGAQKHGVPVGVYFYSQAVSPEEAEEEAAFVLSKIKGCDVTLPVVIDFEYAAKNGANTGRLWEAQLNKKERTALINAFCQKVRDAGYTPGVYASSYIYASQLNMNDIDRDVFIWVADYNKEITYDGPYDFWQYSKDGSCDGVSSKAVDTNYWYTDNRR